MRTVSNKVSLTMTLNGVFLVIWIGVQIANAFGFAAFEPPPEAIVIAPAIVALINLALRYWRTREPISR